MVNESLGRVLYPNLWARRDHNRHLNAARHGEGLSYRVVVPADVVERLSAHHRRVCAYMAIAARKQAQIAEGPDAENVEPFTTFNPGQEGIDGRSGKCR